MYKKVRMAEEQTKVEKEYIGKVNTFSLLFFLSLLITECLHGREILANSYHIVKR